MSCTTRIISPSLCCVSLNLQIWHFLLFCSPEPPQQVVQPHYSVMRNVMIGGGEDTNKRRNVCSSETKTDLQLRYQNNQTHIHVVLSCLRSDLPAAPLGPNLSCPYIWQTLCFQIQKQAAVMWFIVSALRMFPRWCNLSEKKTRTDRHGERRKAERCQRWC